MSQRFGGRKLSWWRVGVLVIIAAALVVGGVSAWGTWRDRQQAAGFKPWVGGYVDATATPSYPFEENADGDTSNMVLSFVVADRADACTPSWGGAYTLDAAESSLDLDRRLVRYRSLGGHAMVSFGGQANRELSLACTDASKLLDGYRAVVERYALAAIDMDIEGELLDDADALTRQATAVASLQKQSAARNELQVWLTLPVATTGLTEQGLDALRHYLDAGVKLAGVNTMTMDYNTDESASMSSRAESSLTAVQRQLRSEYAAHGTSLGDATAWAMVAATPMIGQNDVRGETFTLEDAAALSHFANTKGMSRLSFWSANRDKACDPNWPDPRQVSDSCSGVKQEAGDFLNALSTDRGGVIAQAPGGSPSPEATSDGDSRHSDGGDVVDDPASSPYPVWAPDASYPVGAKVVWKRNVYEAKWWTDSAQPDAPSTDGTPSPWRLIGPVLHGEKPIARPSLPPGTYKTWNPSTSYRRGDRVMMDGQGYEAKWWTRSESPEAALVSPQSSPWQLLTDAQVEQELTRLKKGSDGQ